MQKIICFVCFILFARLAVWGQQDPVLWKAQSDNVYLQEISEVIHTEKPVTSVCAFNHRIYCLMNGNLYELENNQLKSVFNSPGNISRLLTENNLLWALTESGIYLKTENNWELKDKGKFVDLCYHAKAVYGATKDDIFRFQDGKFVSARPKDGYYNSDITMLMEDGSQVHATPVELGPIQRIESYSGTLYVLRPGEIIVFDGKTVNSDCIDWGRLPSRTTTDMLADGSQNYISTGKGLAILRGATLYTVKGTDGLPVENTTCLEKGFDGDIWIGSKRGAIRMLKNGWHYFGADRWLPDNNVNDIAVDNQSVYVATDKGIGIIRYEPYTLLKKAAFYERHIEEFGHKRLGFIHTLYQKDGEWIREISDNDGGHTAVYLAAMCYKYAATRDITARNEAVESFKALMWLNKITRNKGFIARSIWSAVADRDSRSTQGSGGLPAKWYPTPDGKWFWKGDTSSDEVTSHFYAVSLFYDLVAEGREKEMARAHLKAMAEYIIDCGWTMFDMDGKPTRWARWNPEYLLRPYGYGDRGVNGLEILSFMETAIALTGDEKFVKGYKQLIDWGYPNNTIRQKNVFPPESVAPWDDNLAFESYNPLLRYSKDPVLRSIYLRSITRTWEIKRMEQLPWFNFSYGALTGNDCEADKAVQNLRDWPLDCTLYNFTNSHRDDLFPEKGYISYEGGLKYLSPRETGPFSTNRSILELDGGLSGKIIQEPSGFLRDYWMGRYYGLIKAPQVTDNELITVSKSTGTKGAPAYNGPSRPELF